MRSGVGVKGGGVEGGWRGKARAHRNEVEGAKNRGGVCGERMEEAPVVTSRRMTSWLTPRSACGGRARASGDTLAASSASHLHGEKWRPCYCVAVRRAEFAHNRLSISRAVFSAPNLHRKGVFSHLLTCVPFAMPQNVEVPRRLRDVAAP